MKRTFLLLLVLVVCAVVGIAYYWHERAELRPTASTYPVFLRPVESVPVLANELSESKIATVSGIESLTVSADAVYILDLESGSVLYKKNDSVSRAPASTTKLVTALVTVEAFQLDQVLTVTKEATTAGATTGFYKGEQLTVENILKAMLISSGNDAAYMVANNYPGGYEAFTSRMNTLATEIGMQNSRFENPAGFDAVGHYTTAYDLSVVAREVMKVPVLREIVSTPETVISDVSGRQFHRLYTTNQLLIDNPQVVGIKTGTTELAKQVLVSQYETEDRRNILVVLMGSQDRFADTSQITDWIYNRYQWKLYPQDE